MESFKKNAIFLIIASWLAVDLVSFFSLKKVLQGQCNFLSYWPVCDQSANQGLQFIAVALVVALLIASGWLIIDRLFRNELTVGNKHYAVIAFSLFSAVIMLPFASADTQYYFNVGKALGQGINPYVQNWEMTGYFADSQSGTTLGVMYGPLSLAAFKVFYELSGGLIVAFVLYWKIFMALVLLTVGCLLWRLLKESELPFSKNAFLFFWLTQPLLLWEWVGNGHFDGLWLIFVLLAFLLAKKDKWLAVVICLVLGAWIKFIPIIITPWFALWWWQGVDKDNWKSKVGELSLGALVAAAITYFSWHGYWQGASTLKPILIQVKWSFGSVFGAIYYSLKPVSVALLGNSSHYYLTRLVHLLIFTATAYMLWPLALAAFKIIFKKIVLTQKDYLSYTLITLSVYLMVWQKSLWPWYLIWITALGLVVYFMTRNERLKKIVVYLSLAPLTFYAPAMILGDKMVSPVFYWYVFVTITMYPLYQLFLWRREDYKI